MSTNKHQRFRTTRRVALAAAFAVPGWGCDRDSQSVDAERPGAKADDANGTQPPRAVEQGRIALVQFTSDLRSRWGRPDVIRDAMEERFDDAVDGGANIVVFPEGAAFGYEEEPAADITKFDRKRVWCAPHMEDFAERARREVFCVDPVDVAEPVPSGPTTQFWASKAEEAGVWAVIPVWEKITDEPDAPSVIEDDLGIEFAPQGPRYADTAVLVGPNGYIGKHRKLNRWQNESHIDAVLGEKTTVLQTPYGRFGVLICAGVFADKAKEYEALDLDAVLFPADWVEKSYEGFHGPSEENTFTWMGDFVNVDFFAADDSGSSRTGFFPGRSRADGLRDVRVPDDRQDRTMLLDFDFSRPEIVVGEPEMLAYDTPRGED